MVFNWLKSLLSIKNIYLIGNSIFQLITLFVLVSCKPEINVDLLKKNKLSNPTKPTLIFPVAELEILSGDSILIPTSNGLGPYTADLNPIGNFDNATTTYTAPDSLANSSFALNLSDSTGLSGQLPIKIIGLKEKFLLDQPLSYGDQNYPMGVTQTDDGSIYVTSVVIDGTGWEYLATFKSTDNGTSWNMVDRFYMYLAGETHPLDITAVGNDVYVCGYTWGYGGTPGSANTEWLVRKSSNGGLSWVNVDHSWLSLSSNSCTTITSASNGDIFSAGYSSNISWGNDAIIKMSIDNGNSWQIIGNFPNAGQPTSIRMAPNGDLWVVVDNKLYKATYLLGSWNWSSPVNMNAAGFNQVMYQEYGQLTIVDNSTAYFTGRSSGLWKIYRTTDAGATWNEIHARTGEGVTSLILSTGEIISNGGRTVSYHETYLDIIKSIDSGVNFSVALSVGGVGNQHKGGYLYELQNGDLISIGTRRTDDQMVVNISTDKGSTWTERSIIYYFDRLYSEVEDYAEDSIGNIYTAGWVSSTNEGNSAEPYVIMKSSNNGIDWTKTDFVIENNVDHFSDQIEVSPLNNFIFATDHSYTTSMTNLRMSSNSGSTWTTVDTLAGYVSNKVLEIDKNGNVYYLVDKVLRKGSPTGTGFSTIYNFPVVGSQTDFNVKSLIALSNGELLLGATAFEAPSASYSAIYRSTDGGSNWTEVFRTSSSTWKDIDIVEAKNQDLYILSNEKIFKSSDNASTWTEIYNSTLGMGSPKSLVTSDDSKIFFASSSDIYFYSTSTSSWKPFWKIDTAITPNIDSYIKSVFNCKFSKIGVCANIVDYTKGQGTSNILWAAE